MNTNAPIWNDYIQFYTRPTPPLAIVPKTVTAQPVTDVPAIMVSRYLGTRRVDKPDGTHVIREMWSHACYEFMGYVISYLGFTFVRIRDMHGVLTLPQAQVRDLPAMAETKAA